ncbi:hypothetical protein PVAND_005553 [Polypedilum vanderplanki]|uniref:Uncharacterized protein n=1 Tax=Polypedilum vanderplanki TaxID=319348 RepID=A0A9J6C0Y9_POLVA|nr:hypothetical protein PVAND_005553 [Polypedilum vanderplanki]
MRFTILLYLQVVLLVSHISSELPKIIKVCPRSSSDLNKCIIESIELLRPHITIGDLGDNFTVPKLEPLSIDEIIIDNGNDLEANFKNLSVFGPSKFNVLNLNTNITQMQFDFDLELPSLEFFGDYSIVLNILIKFRGKGKLKGLFKNCKTHVKANAKIIDEQNHMEFTLDVKMKVSYAQFELQNLFDNDSFLSKLGNRIINDNYEIFLNELKPGLEKSLGKIFSNIVNNILKNSTYDEMFPE